ncbi:MAG: hypothetical protein IJF67_12180 [Clostridia bacterium]|nr:hypothetical protein [Clostridia bacterium]
MHETDHIDEIAESLKSYWKFMLAFALLIMGLVTYVNALGMLTERNDTNILLTAYIDAPPEEERILQIFAYTMEKDDRGKWTSGLRRLYDGEMARATTMDPQLEFYGEGFIELQYSDHVGRSIAFGRPHEGDIADRVTGKNGWAYRENEMLAAIPASIIRNIDPRTDEVADWHFDGTEFKYRDYNRISYQYLGEADPNVSLAFWHCRRYMSETHLFVTLHSNWRQSEVIATATLRLRSHYKWRDTYARNQLTDRTDPYMLSNTTVELVDYWQADDWVKE